jgi:protein phosphatase
LTESILKPRDQDIDAFGLTHPGKVREGNEDHFLIAALSKHLRVERTSLPDNFYLLQDSERIANVALVADGVGKGGGGEEASRVAIQAVSQYVTRSMEAFYNSNVADADDPEEFSRILSDAAMDCHMNLVKRAELDPDKRRFGTTLTLWLGLWPHAYLLQVGDSRAYMFRDGTLSQISRDQTMAQDLIDQGVMTRTAAHRTRWAHVLSSAIGGNEALPVVTRITRDWGTVILLCSDGLTKHVSDERIAEALGSMTSAKQVCEDLLQEALDDGGSDNITIIVGRTIKPMDR